MHTLFQAFTVAAAFGSLAALWLLKENERVKDRNAWLETKITLAEEKAARLETLLKARTAVTDETIATRHCHGKTFFVSIRPAFLKHLNRVVVISPYGTRHQIRIRPTRYRRKR